MKLYHGSNVPVIVPDNPQEAIDVLYTSETFERIQDNSTGLYYQSPGYVYSFLQNELTTAKVI